MTIICPNGHLGFAPIRVEPPAIRVSGPRQAIEAIDSVVTMPVELGGLRGSVVIGVASATAVMTSVLPNAQPNTNRWCAPSCTPAIPRPTG